MFSSPPLRRLFPILLLNLVAFGVAIPILPALTLELGGSATDIGFLFALQAFGQFAMAPVWGDFSDRLGRKPVLATAIAAMGVFEVATAATTSLPVLYAVRLGSGLAAGNIATATALIADSTDASSRSAGMALIGISFGIGFTVGPGLGGAVALLPDAIPTVFWQGPGLLGEGLPFLAAGLVDLVAAATATLVLLEPEASTDERREHRTRRRLDIVWNHPNARRLAQMCGLFFCYTVAIAVLEVTFFPYAEELYGYDESEIGFIFAGMGLLMAAVQGGVGKISSILGDRRMTGLGLVLMTVGLALVPIWTPLGWLLTFVAVATVGRALTHPGALSLTSELAEEPEERGKLMGVLQSSGSLGRIAGPAAGGALFDYVAIGAPFAASALLLGLAGAAWWWATAGDPTGGGSRPRENV